MLAQGIHRCISNGCDWQVSYLVHNGTVLVTTSTTQKIQKWKNTHQRMSEIPDEVWVATFFKTGHWLKSSILVNTHRDPSQIPPVRDELASAKLPSERWENSFTFQENWVEQKNLPFLWDTASKCTFAMIKCVRILVLHFSKATWNVSPAHLHTWMGIIWKTNTAWLYCEQPGGCALTGGLLVLTQPFRGPTLTAVFSHHCRQQGSTWHLWYLNL